MAGIQITTDGFGKTKDGVSIKRFSLKNQNKVEVRIINYGAIITDILVPDRQGKIVDINLGFDDIEGYESDRQKYFGAICGRVANRIANGKFTLDGKEYMMVVNNGPNHLHGGIKGFDKGVWDVSVKESKLEMTYVSADGEENYPGEVTTKLTYELTNTNELIIDYTSTTTKPTPINLTNHAYFNLAGQGYPNIDDHIITLKGTHYTPLNENVIPTGEIASVDGTPYDLRTPARLGDRIKEVNQGKGFDINYCVGETGKMKYCARVEHPPSGRVLEVSTTEPGLQLYTSYYLNGVRGKGDSVYRQFGAFCLETQHYADSVNHSNFPSTVLRPGDTYRHTTVYKFSTV